MGRGTGISGHHSVVLVALVRDRAMVSATKIFGCCSQHYQDPPANASLIRRYRPGDDPDHRRNALLKEISES